MERKPTISLKEAVLRLNKLPLLKRGDISDSEYRGFEALRELLQSRDESDPHLLKKSNVSGIWLFKDRRLERTNAPQLFVRSSLSGEDMRSLNLEIFEIVHHDVIYDYNEDFVKKGSILLNNRAVIAWEIENERLFTVYDKFRKG